MSSNVYTSHAAERVIFLERFENPAKVYKNGGILVGDPVIKDGVILTGSEYVSYAIPASLLVKNELSFVSRFIAGFAADDATNHFLWDTPLANRYLLYKTNGNDLIAYMAGTLVLSIGLGSYSAYWNAYAENEIIVSSTPGSSQMYLNGTLVGSSATVWTPNQTTSLFIGKDAAVGYFEGTYKSLKIQSTLLTQADVDRIQDNSLYTYPSRASIFLDFKESTAKAGTIRGTTELLADGDMEAAGVGAWAQVNNANYSKVAGSPGGVGSQVMHVAHDGIANPAVQQLVLVVGRRYRVRGWARGDGTAVPRVLGGAGAISWTGTSSASWQYFDTVGVAGATSMNLRATTAIAGWCEFDDISAVETDELLDDSDMEATGVADWTANDSTLSKLDDDVYIGKKLLRITQTAPTFWASQAPLTPGVDYHVTARARGDGTRIPSIFVTGGLWVGSAANVWQDVDEIFSVTGSSFLIGSSDAGAGYVEFADVHVRPVLARTLDKSPAGHVCLLGDGSTANTIPDFLNPGFGLDGVNHYLLLPQTAGVYNNAEQSIAAVFRPGFAADDGAFHYLFDSTAGSRYTALKNNTGSMSILLGNLTIGTIPLATYEPYWVTGGLNVLVVASESGNTDVTLNGVLIMDADNTAWSPVDPAEITLGASAALGSPFSGEFEGFMTWPEKLSPLQVADLTLRLGVLV
ncbi:hypothetical protein LCGC14_0905670 [marine sediment metagenome]|uniref:Uncharacterized protein n=1 Tax=marine sediment metagenome TaxID=412755 RepID=A0A0F9S203_9ZZZZ